MELAWSLGGWFVFMVDGINSELARHPLGDLKLIKDIGDKNEAAWGGKPFLKGHEPKNWGQAQVHVYFQRGV